MDPARFDTIARLFASRATRRTALAGGLGLAATGLGARALAQESTPSVATPAIDTNDPHPSADAAQPKTEFLFVQPFDSGTWAPKDDEDGTYTLTLAGAAAQTVYFSDRPERIVGIMPNQSLLDGLGFTPENPPNAAIVAPHEGGDAQEILVIELLTPVYDAEAATLTYDARVLADYGEPGLAHLAQQQTDYEFPASFGPGSLFIDDWQCGAFTDGACYQVINGNVVIVGQLDIDLCSDLIVIPPICNTPCDGDGTSKHYGKLCHEKYPDTCNYYSGDTPDGWDCFARGAGI